MKNPKAKARLSGLVSFVLVALAFFLSAGTFHYWQAWVYLGGLAIATVPLLLLIVNDPILIENRTKGGPTVEQRPIQRIIIWFTVIPGVALFVLPGLDRRFGWSNVPLWLVIVGDLLMLVSMWMAYRVFKANSYGSATIEVVKDQKVITTGPYAIVRNPMYSSATLYFIGTSLALGSYWTLIPAIFTTSGLVWRLFDEEKFLAQNLPGYTEYCSKVKWHLVPGIF